MRATKNSLPPLTAHLPIDYWGSPFQFCMPFKYYSKHFFWECFIYATYHRWVRHGSALSSGAVGSKNETQNTNSNPAYHSSVIGNTGVFIWVDINYTG